MSMSKSRSRGAGAVRGFFDGPGLSPPELGCGMALVLGRWEWDMGGFGIVMGRWAR